MPKFIGVKSELHIHCEGNPYHIRNGNGERLNFDPNKDAQVKLAIAFAEKYKDRAGYAACMKYLK